MASISCVDLGFIRQLIAMVIRTENSLEQIPVQGHMQKKKSCSPDLNKEDRKKTTQDYGENETQRR